jgi:hypothetical protein
MAGAFGGTLTCAGLLPAVVVGFALAACAGRDPHPVAVVQPQDAQSDCAMIRAEIEANNVQAEKLAEENHAKIAQNVAAGVVGVVVWPVWFAMDAKGAAGTEMDALKSQQYLPHWLSRGANSQALLHRPNLGRRFDTERARCAERENAAFATGRPIGFLAEATTIFDLFALSATIIL